MILPGHVCIKRPSCRASCTAMPPVRRAAFELSPRHSITSSAVAISLSGIVRPSPLAVLRLMIISNFTGAWTGSSPGFAPLRMRST